LLATPIKSFATFTADYYLYDIASKKIKEIIDFQVQEPTPDGKK
jgi:dipeptidyl-peptidase-4